MNILKQIMTIYSPVDPSPPSPRSVESKRSFISKQ